jgi:Undecaprenyl-phosphate glucose phosphotransferase
MSLRLKSFGFYVRLWLYLLPTIAFLIAAEVRLKAIDLNRHPAEFDPWFYFGVLTFITLVWAIAVERQRLCDIDELFRENTGIRKSLAACFATYTVLLSVLFFYRQQNFSRVFFVVSSVALLMLTVGTRVVLRRLQKVTRHGRGSIPILMVGAGHHARRVAEGLARVPLVTSQVVAYLRLGDEEIHVKDAPVVQFDDIGFGRVTPFEEIVIAAVPQQLSEMDDLLDRIGMLCVPIRVVLDLGKLPVVRDRLFQLGDLQMLDLVNTPLESPAYFFLKRAFDIAFSAVVLLAFWPFLLFAALAIKLTSHGPILFRQERVGLNGKRFEMYKFRSMLVADPNGSDTLWTVKDDPRRTGIGAWLRKTSLDELPQFLNVLRGDMSVVGPRPERPHFVRRFLDEIDHYDSRHRLKVGITGWAQVNGWRGDTSIAKRFEFDLYYLQNWSFWFDLRIILLTGWSGMFGRNAY